MKVYFYFIFKKALFNAVYIIFFLPAFFTGTGNVNSAELIDRIVAVVNDKIITLSELNISLQPYLLQIRSMGRAPEEESQFLYTVRQKALDKLINDKLTDLKAKEYQVNITDDDIDRTIERIKESNYHTDEDFRKILAQEGLTVEEYRLDIRNQMTRSRVVDYEVRSKVVITKEDIMAYYNANQEKYAGQKKYRLRNILMKPSPFAGEGAMEKILDKMQNILAQLQEGESFSELARLYSQSPYAGEGGDLGFFKLDDISPQIRNAFKELKAGEWTEALDTEQGFQIFYIEEIEDSPGKSLEEVSQEIEKLLYNEKMSERFNAWVKEMRAKAHIKIIQ